MYDSTESQLNGFTTRNSDIVYMFTHIILDNIQIEHSTMPKIAFKDKYTARKIIKSKKSKGA